MKKLVEKDLTTGEMAIQLVISEKAGDERSCEEDAQGGDPALLQKTQSAVKKGKIRKKKKRRKFPVMKKRSCKDSSQTDNSYAKRKLQYKFKSKTKKAILRKLA